MSLFQKIILSCVPVSWARNIEEESRRWKYRCECGHEKSVWEAGGIRWKAVGRSKKYGLCSQCGKWGWLVLYKE